MKLLQPQPLTAEAFAPFGEVIQCQGAQHFPINEGTTERFHDLARIEPGANGRAIVSIFRGQPRSFPLLIAMMERHPLGSQAFVPMQGQPYLVVVAEPGAQAPGNLHAFLARGDQGVNYAPGVWHHPLIAVGEVSHFLVIDRQGDGSNCDEVILPEKMLLELPPAMQIQET
ncbi:MAG: ureidoglycolate lyase [Betaproteobacteria bacterium]|nr:ureidoglycolate lyase [Betaproteobacteria bacterium]